MIMSTPKTLLLCTLIASTTLANGQAYGELQINDVRARFHAHGRIGYAAGSGEPQFEVPAGSGSHVLFSAGLWLVGIDPDAGPRGAAMMYEGDSGNDFYPGPLTTDGSASITPDVMAQYDQVWSVTRAEVMAHLDYFNCLSDPGCDVAAEYPDGYEIAPALLNWPAINTDPGYSTYLAPFYDFNSDGDYDPAVGDAPCILGDEALFLVFNDKGGPHLYSGMLAVGIEVQAMPFAYQGPGTWKDQTVFVRYKIINRGTHTVESTRLGFFNDFDLGCGDDDFFGTDPSRNLVYIYNNDDLDENCLGNQGYGAQPPAFGQMILKGPLLDPDGSDNAMNEALPAWNGSGFGDGIMDNERSGISHSMAMNREAPSCCNDPTQGGHFYNYLNGYWKDGTPLSYGGTGYSTEPDALPCAFIFPGDDDPLGTGTNGLVQDPWAEVDPSTPDRRSIMSMNAFTLEPGEHVDLLIAYVYARAGNGGPLASVQLLQERADSVRAFAATLPIWNTFGEDIFYDQCADYPTVGIGEARRERLVLFPVPASESVHVIAPTDLAGELLMIKDAAGRLVVTQRLEAGPNTIGISLLGQGLYTVEVRAVQAHYTGRLLKQ